MKKGYLFIGLLTVLSFTVTGIFLIFTPDKIPAHYNAAGEVDRMGSKFEYLLFPIASALIGGLMALLAKTRKAGSTDENILLITGIASQLVFQALSVYFLYKAVTYDETIAVNASGAYKLSSILLGSLLAIMGNIMPKARRNFIFGMRTKWSLSNDAVWQKSQRFAGFTSVACGIGMIVSTIFTSGIFCLAISIVLILLWSLLCAIQSYRYYRIVKGDQS